MRRKTAPETVHLYMSGYIIPLGLVQHPVQDRRGFRRLTCFCISIRKVECSRRRAVRNPCIPLQRGDRRFIVSLLQICVRVFAVRDGKSYTNEEFEKLISTSD